MEGLADAINKLYSELTVLAEDVEELAEDEPREAIAEVLSYCFVHGEVLDEDPTNYELVGADENRRVADVIETFLEDAVALAEAEGVDAGEPRFELLQRPDLRPSERAEIWWPLEDDEFSEPASLPPRRFELPVGVVSDANGDGDEDPEGDVGAPREATVD